MSNGNLNSDLNSEQGIEVDRSFTIVATIAGLTIGVVLAAIVGFILLKLSQPISEDANGRIQWALSGFMLPITLLATTGIVAWSVFHLPVVMARRRDRILDPQVWPAAGVIAMATVIIAVFVLAILTAQI